MNTFRFIVLHLTKGVPNNTRNQILSTPRQVKSLSMAQEVPISNNIGVRVYTSRLDNDPAGIAHRLVHWLPKPGRWVRFPLPALNSPFV